MTRGSITNIVQILRIGKLVRAVHQAKGIAIIKDISVTVDISNKDLPRVCRDLILNKEIHVSADASILRVIK
tara:strand:- start:257 stop:472 length:216 start_codon:yes stop_codon:yes gene_type:complete